MRQTNASEDRRHALGSLLKRLEKFATAKSELLRQLEDLNVRERVVQQEYNALLNADVPALDLPDEIFAMIFKIIHSSRTQRSSDDNNMMLFEVLASHVSRRWRQIALGMPDLWTQIR
ncbi:hypothetical protein FIBSPDRAFT_824799, partial [Athelia psychrophila]